MFLIICVIFRADSVDPMLYINNQTERTEQQPPCTLSPLKSSSCILFKGAVFYKHLQHRPL